MKKSYLALALIVILVIGGIFFYNRRSDLHPVEKKTILIPIDDVTLKNMFNEENRSFFVYVGRPTCPFCNEYRPHLEETIKEKEDITVYYFDTDDNRENPYFAEVITKLGIESVPFLIYIEDGKVISMHGYEDGNTVESIKNWIEDVKS